MKSVLILSLLVVLANCSLDEEIWNALSSRDQKMFDECISELKLEDKSTDNITEPEIKCLVQCVMEKGGEMKDGEFVEENVQKALKEEEKVPEELKKKGAEKIPGCIESSKVIVDKCDKAFAFIACMMKGMTS